MHPDTPVIVEWYTYERIPRTHHALLMTWANALRWRKQGVQMTCYTVDTDLYEGLFHERDGFND
jgi:hypothetical protein